MKRQLIHFAVSAGLAMPLMAQEPYHPSYGYNPDGGYDTDNTTRQFNVNPGDVMDRMGNPMRSFFGSSNRRYEDYPAGGYAPPAYPPAYGYPAYPGYQPPYGGYGYAPQAPNAPAYPAANTPPASPYPQAEPATQPMRPPSAYDTPPPAAMDYQPMFVNPDQASDYRFRPMQDPASTAVDAPLQPTPSMQNSQQPPESLPPTSVYREPEPLAPLTYPQNQGNPQPLAPLSYPEVQTPTPAPQVEMRDAAIPQDPNLKFRPLDKPGYSSELGQ